MIDVDHATIEQATSDLGPGPWWIAHDEPERPADDWTLWDDGCDACFIHLLATARTRPTWGLGMNTVRPDGSVELHQDVSAVCAKVTEWRRSHGLWVPE